MKQFKGTPGPWSVSKTGRSVGSVGGDDGKGFMLPVAWLESYANPAINQANANLISAAPKLLLALQAMVSKAQKQNWNANYPVELQQAVDAINEALGGE